MQRDVVRTTNGLLTLAAIAVISLAVSTGLELLLISAVLVAIVYNHFFKSTV